MASKKIAIMQPYFFPYIGYFQLINAVDVFVFYDDVNFIKKGWINRNNILINGQVKLITVPLQGVSQNLHINQISVNNDAKWKDRLLKTLEHNYKKALNYDLIYPLLKEVIYSNHQTIADLSIYSVQKISKYLEIDTQFEKSSLKYSRTRNLDRALRLIEITKLSDSDNYINPKGGIELYNKEDFKSENIKLDFLKTGEIIYPQFSNEFVANLSIIDVLMFNSKADVKAMLNQYTLI